ncbi:hypothetical protein [Nonomuraea phyllanthi]|nr:hypothetical protein [Nonomuraea phyllanthi]
MPILAYLFDVAVVKRSSPHGPAVAGTSLSYGCAVAGHPPHSG